MESVEKCKSKLRRSCEWCRTSKGKCIPSTKDYSRCQRCMKDQKTCVFLRAKPRPKRAKESRTRVEQIEERLDGIYALLQSTTPPSQNSLPTPQSSNQSLSEFLEDPITDFLEPYSSGQLYQSSQPLTHPTQISPFTTPLSFSYISSDDIQDVISKGMVTYDQAEEALRLFRETTRFFPFVVVPPQASLNSLRREKPSLLLSILAFGTKTHVKLQKALDRELREVMSKDIVFGGKKSLDLLQCALVYLSRYHLFFNPERDQTYQLSQMIAIMAAELGIDKPPRRAKHADTTMLTHAMQGGETLPSAHEIESKRTFLGCYFLSSSFALRLRKTSSLKYSDYVGKCNEVISLMGGAGHDYLIPYFIRLQQFAEEVDTGFDYRTLDYSHQDSMRLGFLVKGFQKQLDQMHSSFPANIWGNVQLTMTYSTLRIYIHEVAFYACPPSAREIFSDHFNYRTWYSSQTRCESLISCLEAAKKSLDYWLSMSSDDVLSLTFPDYLSLVYAVLVLAQFVSGLDCPMIDCAQVSECTNLGYYLSALILKTEEWTIATHCDDTDNTCFSIMKSLWLNCQAWYDALLAGGSSEVLLLAEMQLDFMSILPSIASTDINIELPVHDSLDYMKFIPSNGDFIELL